MNKLLLSRTIFRYLKVQNKLRLKKVWFNCLRIVIFVLLANNGFATNYYVSSAGNDNNPGTSENQAWRSLSKVNSANLQSGDKVLFQRGDTFFGTLQVKNSSVTYTSYGSGSMPVISGLKQVTDWENTGDGIYRGNFNFSGKLNLVLIDDQPVAVGRYPNSGYLSLESRSGTSSIIDNQLSSSPNWTGAEVVIRANHWILDRNYISNHSGNTINYEASSSYVPREGFGYFIQSDLKTLDSFGEWYFDNGNLYMYFGSKSPSSYTIEATTVETLVEMDETPNAKLEGLEFRGANDKIISIDYAQNVTIDGCSINYSGRDGIYVVGGEGLEVNNNSINHCMNNGIVTRWDSNNIKFIGNSINNIGMIPGMGASADGMYIALSTSSENAVIRYNHIHNIGYNGIDFDGNNTLVENNMVSSYCQYKDDGGGIYSFMEGDIGFRFTGVIIRNNIILNGGSHQEEEGIEEGSPNQVEGIYTDGLTNSYEITGNTVAYIASAGIYLNTPRYHNVHNNTLFANKKAQFHLHNLRMGGTKPQDVILEDNIVFNLPESQHSIHLTDDYGTEILDFGSSNSNKFVTLEGNEPSFFTITYSGSWKNNYYNLPQWKSELDFDTNSEEFSTLENDYLFEYNASKTEKTVSLTQAMIDVYGKKYSGSVTVAPYSSVLLLPDPDGEPTGATPVETEENIFICEGEMYNTWTESGQYERTLQTVEGNDSIVTTYLEVNPAYNSTENITITAGENYQGWTETGQYNRTLVTIAGCDSLVTTNLIVTDSSIFTQEGIAICEGESYQGWTTAGEYQRVLQSAAGADSIVTTNLMVNPVYNNTENISIKESESYKGWSESGTYTQNLISISGCDSTVITNLQVIGSVHTSEYITICEGEAYNGNTESGVYQRTVTISKSNPDANLFSNGDFSNGIDDWYSWKNEGYNINLSVDENEFVSAPAALRIDCTSNGDIVYYLQLIAGGAIELVSGREYELRFNAKATTDFTMGSLILIKGSDPWTEYGTFSEEKPVITTKWNEFKIKFEAAHTSSDASFRIYLGNSLPEGHSLYLDDISLVDYSDLEVATQDSVITTYLTVTPTSHTTEAISILEGETYQGWTSTGVYERTLTSATGCDSIVTTNLTVEKPQEAMETHRISLSRGWNIISSYVEPTKESFDKALEELAKINPDVVIEDEDGNTLEKHENDDWVNNIGEYKSTEGYKIWVGKKCTLEFTGIPVKLPFYIDLHSGWNIISFPYNGKVNAMKVIQPLIDAGILKKVQDEKGNSIEYWDGKHGWINRIGNFIADKGYQVFVTNDAVLQIKEHYEKSELVLQEYPKATHFDLGHEENGTGHMNVNITQLAQLDVQIGDEIATFDGNICVGAIKLSASHIYNNAVGLNASVWEKDLPNGFIEGDLIEVRLYKNAANKEMETKPIVIGGELIYNQRASVFIQLNTTTTDIDDPFKNQETLHFRMYPNPARQNVNIHFSSLPPFGTHIILMDITGKQILNREVQSDLEVLNIEGQAHGIYLVKTILGNKFKIQKLVIN